MQILSQGLPETAEMAEEKIEYIVLQYKRKPLFDFFKRLFDIIVSFTALVLLFPLLIITSIIIMVDDFGNPIYTQKRVGKNGKVFTMFKFRSMFKDAEKLRMSLEEKNEVDGPIFKIKDDPRVTRVGNIIRKTSIDELPQLLNIFLGSMSFVGPRPFVTYESEKFTDYQNQRNMVKPGLTGLWQISNRNGQTFDEAIELDFKYIRERSARLDFKIMIGTFLLVFKGGGDF